MKHPIQPIEVVAGVPRFKQNAIVEFLLREGGFDMNALAGMDFPKEDREQFAQLIGYSVSGFGDLSYADPETVRAADIAVDEMQMAEAVGWSVRSGKGYWRRIGVAGVDSGQMMLADPCYVDSQWKEASEDDPSYRATLYLHKDGTKYYCRMHGFSPDPDAIPFDHYEAPMEKHYNATPNQMIAAGDLVRQPKGEPTGEFSYAGCCEVTLAEPQAGQLNYEKGHAGAGVVFSTGFGDGVYDVFARYVDEGDWGTRIAEVRAIFIEDADFPPEPTEQP